MKVLVSLSLLLSLTICDFTVTTDSLVDDDDMPNSRDMVFVHRGERSLWATWRQLLSDARIYSKGPPLRWYKKEGGYNQAIADFKALRPTAVTKLKDGFIGQVGNQKIHLYRTDESTMIEMIGKVTNAYPLGRERRVIQYPH